MQESSMKNPMVKHSRIFMAVASWAQMIQEDLRDIRWATETSKTQTYRLTCELTSYEHSLTYSTSMNSSLTMKKKEKKNYEKRNSKTDASANDSFRETFNATWTIRFDHREIYDHLDQALNNSLSEKILVVF